MAQQTINVGTAPNDGTGTPLRTAFQYTNSNFSELYTAVGPSGNNIVCPGSATITGDLTVKTNVLKVDTTNNRVGIGTATPLNAAQIQGIGQATVTPTVTGDGSALSLIDSAGLANSGGMVAFGAAVANGNIGQVSIKSLLTNGSQNGTSDLAIFTRAATSDTTLAERFRIAQGGICTWSNVGGSSGTAMTLNSTGLGVGVASPLGRFHVRQSGAGIQDVGYLENAQAAAADVGPRLSLLGVGSIAMATVESGWNGAANTDAYLSFRTRGSGAVTERLRIDSSGNVGIGIAPSVSKLHVGITSTATSGLAEANALKIENNNATVNNAAGLFLSQTGDAGCGIAGIATSRTGGSRASALALYYYSQATSASPIEGARLNASGTLLVGLTTNTGTYSTPLVISSNAGTVGWSNGPTAANPSNFYISGTGGNGVYLNGVAATSWTAISDARFKDIIEPINDAVAKVGSLRSVIGKFKTDAEGVRRSFLIAQDVQAVLPEAVDASNPDRLGVAYTEVIPLLVAAIKELTARVQTLETR